jgi:hypothetical protein
MQKLVIKLVILLTFSLATCNCYANERWELSEGLKSIGSRQERGIFLFAVGQFEKAVNEFTYVLEQPWDALDDEVIGVALWGKTLGDAILGKTLELQKDLDKIAEFADSGDCGCGQVQLSEYDESNRMILNSRYNDDDENNYAFCRDSVINTVRFMKNFINDLPTLGAKYLIFDLIDYLAEKAMKCCRGMGFWRQCVKPMVDKMNFWKSLGYIPAKP